MTTEFKGDKKEIHYKIVGFDISEAKEVKTDKGEFGTFKGYAATYGNVDRGGDIIKKGAFVRSLKRHLDENRHLRMFFQHDHMFPIGMFPIDKIVDDEKGLFVEGQINLNADKGRSTYALMKQGAISDLSIGYSINDAIVDEDGNFNLIDLELWETSPVSEPMNTEATILSVKKKQEESRTNIDEMKSIKEIESYLKELGLYSQERKTLISKIKSFTRDANKGDDDTRDDESKKEIEESEDNIASQLKEIAEEIKHSQLKAKLNSINSQFKR